ncbi:MAG: YdeI/OmpD-associated family protein [Fidelibacterota bacterium]
MSEDKFRNLKRPKYPMPGFVKKALVERGLMDAYRERPAYQQNDYIGWITRAKREETVEKRLAQMLDELESGDKYMKMDYRPKRPPKYSNNA